MLTSLELWIHKFLAAVEQRFPARVAAPGIARLPPGASARILGADCGWLPHHLRQVWVKPLGEGSWRLCCEPWEGPTRQFEFSEGRDRQAELARVLIAEAGFKAGDAAIVAKWMFESIGHRGAADWFRAEVSGGPQDAYSHSSSRLV